MDRFGIGEVVTPTLPSRRGDPAWEVALLFPTQGQWTEAEYLALNTNWLIELSDGCLEFLPMPTFFHARIVAFLHRELDRFVEQSVPGKVLFAPLPIRLRLGTFRVPDLMYFRPERIRDLHRQPDGADLVMEVVIGKLEDRKRDLETKRQEYAVAGIAEYWIVDPQECSITVLTLDGQVYRTHGIFGPTRQATSLLFPGFSVSVDATFAAADGR
jgi:Uma2 family endonuclease